MQRIIAVILCFFFSQQLVPSFTRADLDAQTTALVRYADARRGSSFARDELLFGAVDRASSQKVPQTVYDRVVLRGLPGQPALQEQRYNKESTRDFEKLFTDCMQQEDTSAQLRRHSAKLQVLMQEGADAGPYFLDPAIESGDTELVATYLERQKPTWAERDYNKKIKKNRMLDAKIRKLEKDSAMRVLLDIESCSGVTGRFREIVKLPGVSVSTIATFSQVPESSFIGPLKELSLRGPGHNEKNYLEKLATILWKTFRQDPKILVESCVKNFTKGAHFDLVDPIKNLGEEMKAARAAYSGAVSLAYVQGCLRATDEQVAAQVAPFLLPDLATLVVGYSGMSADHRYPNIMSLELGVIKKHLFF